MRTGDLGLILFLGAAVVIAAIVAARVAHGIGLPGLLLFLGLGLALGEAGLGVRFDNAGLAQALGLSALVLILAEGGLTTNWVHARSAAPAALSLATVGVAVSILVVAVLTHWLLRFAWRDALLLGAVLAPTDAAAVFSVLRKLPLPPRLAGMLEAESGLNDPPAVLAVTLLSEVGAHAPSPALLAGVVVYELAAGAAIGAAAGFLGAWGLRKVALPASGLYPIAVLALIVASYGAASLAHASGFLAVYLSALVLGNMRLPHGPATRGFAEGVGWLAQIGLFVMLGLLASPARLPAQVLPALVVAGGADADRPARCGARIHPAAAGAVAAAGVPVVGRAARRGADRAGDDPDHARRCRAPPACSTWCSSSSLSTRAAGPHACPRGPAAGGDRPRRAHRHGRGGGAAGGAARRPAADPDPARAPGCTAWRSSSSGCPPRRTSR